MLPSNQSGSETIPAVFNILCGEALDVTDTPYGAVGRLFSGDGIEAVWVSKQDEAIDPGWFSQETVDLLVVLQGELRIEYERASLAPVVLRPGELLVLPPGVRCRGYRWPRDAKDPTVFLAVYPKPFAGRSASHGIA